MAKTIIVSNRLPIKIQRNEKKKLEYHTSAGGLATGLGSIYKEGNNLWIGWPGLVTSRKEEKTEITEAITKESMFPVFLTEDDIKDFYEGFSNETLWPNFHYFIQYAIYDPKLWEAYKRVNRKFADEIAKKCDPDDTLWIHDYQLMLVPGMLREKFPEASIGFFLHIPFPSYEIFRLIPWRRELLNGVLGADLIGFHTYDDMRHFLSSVSRLAALSNTQGQVVVGNRTVMVDSFPMGIDYDKYAEAAASPEALEREVHYRISLGDQKLILSIDRLDYSKGIPQRLRAFELFFERYPQYKDKISLIMVVVPSRDQVGKYKELKEEVDRLVGRINGRFGKINWTPVHFFYRSFPLEELSAFYRMADVALVTPMRDGMNLVCKEFIASKINRKGVLILSEMCGASKELSDAILINPNDVDQLVEALNRALTMPESEQIMHNTNMQNSLKRYNITHWVNLFMTSLKNIKETQGGMLTRKLDELSQEKMLKAYSKAQQRLIFLDYDGTLTGFHSDPKDARPDNELMGILEKLTGDQHNRVIIISGRDKDTLNEWVGKQEVDIIAEHGVWMRENGGEWETFLNMKNNWKKEIFPVLELYVNRTPGSFIEEKDYSLVWHYRKVETGLGELRTRELTSHLKYLSSNSNLQVLEGDKVVEIKDREVNKGRTAARWIDRFKHDFTLAIGDDFTDEDTFKAMPEDAYTVKVGSKNSAARYSVNSFEDVRKLLKAMIAY
jgi:trehalose 6-phosphate synthase/phosphatase